ncbi:MAG TPA: AraC family transcriptional regulator [Lachnospiraceae bacterium]|nr:AraC family transcriptional regulator [Lachnospiraceae bacterium]
MNMEKLFDAEGITKSERLMHTPSTFARKNLLYVQETGQLKSLKAHSCIRENLDSYLFFFVLSGTGSVVFDGEVYEMTEGSCAFIDCRKHYEHKSSEENPWELMWVHFDGQIVEACYPLFYEGNHNSPVFIAKEEKEKLVALVEELRAIPNEQNVLYELQASGLLQQLLISCMEKVITEKAKTEGDTDAALSVADYEAIREYLNTHFAEKNLTQALSSMFGKEFGRINTAFSHRYGITVEDYVENRKFNKAKELLRFTIKPIDEIITQAGFASSEQFHAMFQKNEEMSPEDYRKKWAQWIKG